MNLIGLLQASDERQKLLHYFARYDGNDPEVLVYKEKYLKQHWQAIAAGASHPLFGGRPDRRFKATALQASSLDEPEEPEEEEEDEGTTNEEKENRASRD